MDRMTDMCKNITLPKTSFVAGKNKYSARLTGLSTTPCVSMTKQSGCLSGVFLGGVFLGGVCWGVCLPWGVCQGVSVMGVSVCRVGCLYEGCLLGVCLPGVSAGGWCLPRGCLPDIPLLTE